jgi:hypothetical protein
MEKSDPARNEIETVMEQAEKVAARAGLPGEYTNYSFRRRKDHAGLQCVDAIAWMSYQVSGLHAFYGTPIHPFADLGWSDLLSRNIGGVAGPFEWI